MKIIFIIGIQIILDGKNINEENIDKNDTFAVIYFKNIDLSYSFAKQFICNKNICYFSDILPFFIGFDSNMYSFSISDYTIHILKKEKNLEISFSPFSSQLETLEHFIDKKINNFNFRIKNTEVNINILMFFVNYCFVYIVIILIITTMIISYKIYIPNPNLERKELLYNLILNNYN